MARAAFEAEMGEFEASCSRLHQALTGVRDKPISSEPLLKVVTMRLGVLREEMDKIQSVLEGLGRE